MKNEKKLHGFSYSKIMANFEAFRWNISSSINLLFLKSDNQQLFVYKKIFLGLTDSAQLSLLQNDGSFVILCTLYLLLGLALLAMCFSIFRDALWHYPRLSSCFGIQNHYYCGKDGNSHPGMLYSKSHLSSWVYNETPS